MTGLFITATGTGMGKTYVTQSLLQWDLRQAGLMTASKPIISGWPNNSKDIQHTDTVKLLQAQNQACTAQAIATCSPWRYCQPLTPEMAAQREGKKIPREVLVRLCKQRCAQAKSLDKIHLIEGVGGVMSPLAPKFTVLDWLAEIECDCMLVVGSYLGSLSHTLTAVSALQTKGIAPLVIIVSETPESTVSLFETSECLLRFLPNSKIITLQYGKNNQTSIASLYKFLVQKLLRAECGLH